MSLMTFTMVPTSLFRLGLTLWTLRRGADNALDRSDEHVYRRTLTCRGMLVDIAVVQVGSRPLRPRR
jgi:hypothetical protein